MTECYQCGEYKFCTWQCDPFTEEIWPDRENPFGWWCDDCDYEARMDI